MVRCLEFDCAYHNLLFCPETLAQWIEKGVKCVWVRIPGEVANIVPMLYKVWFSRVFDFNLINIICFFCPLAAFVRVPPHSASRGGDDEVDQQERSTNVATLRPHHGWRW